MTFEEAALDPARPLSITPREWMYSVEAELAQEEELVNGTAKRLLGRTASNNKDDEPTGFEKIDLGIDQMVQGVFLSLSGIEDSRMVDLDPKTRKAVEDIKDLIETAIEPYLADIIKISKSVEDDDIAEEKAKLEKDKKRKNKSQSKK